ncbi:MAG: PhzF family phenazine biosynthesis isomerase [Candidatus Zixiibacteriota bacterium]
MRFQIYDVSAQRPFEGNPTGVVYADHSLETDLMQRLANELSLPDTIFLLPGSRPDLLFTSRTFTPYQELEICGQGLVGAVYALMEDRDILSGQHTVETAIGNREVVIERHDSLSVFCSLGRPTITELPSDQRLQIGELLGRTRIKPDMMAFVDLGRKRLILDVRHSELERVDLARAQVIAICRTLGITEVVLCAYGNDQPPLVRSHHFTTSLLGAEDAVTGGAAGAILAFYRHAGESIDQLRIHQGDFATRGGLVIARFNPSDNEIQIGGDAVKIADGGLCV